MNQMDLGKDMRIQRLKNALGFYCFLALDHQMSSGRIDELDVYQRWLDFSDSTPISGVVLNKGAFRHVSAQTKTPLILQTIGGPVMGGDISRISTASVEDAIRVNATAISIQINFEESGHLQQLALCVDQIAHANRFGVPVLCMLNVRDLDAFDISTFLRYVKFCAELDVDLIKSPFPKGGEAYNGELKGFLSGVPPVLLAGGPQDGRFSETLEHSLRLGFQGVCVGRNIFMSRSPETQLEHICKAFGDEC
jgi:DhnA family fructose-bisphosphate aldolase class Ia